MSIALAAAGMPELSRQRVLSVVGLSLPIAITRLVPQADEATVLKIADHFRTVFGNLRNDPNYSEPLYDGMVELIYALAAKDDYLLSVATGKSRRGMNALLDRLDLHAQFISVQTADTHPSKPHPSMIETALRDAGVEADRAVMIGDTTYDIEMAKNAGVAAIGVSWGYHPAGDLTHAGAHAIAEDANGLMQAIEQSLQSDT